MSGKKVDARVRYTKLVIRNSFIELIKQKGLAKVTVTDICALAEINRATFYAHYRDVMDLLQSLENELMDNIISLLTESLSKNGPDLHIILPGMLRFIRSEADICLVLISDMSSSGFVRRCMELIQGLFVDYWTKQCSISTEVAESLYLYGAMGSVGLLHRWLNKGCPQSPEYMADLIISLFNKGASSYELSAGKKSAPLV